MTPFADFMLRAESREAVSIAEVFDGLSLWLSERPGIELFLRLSAERAVAVVASPRFGRCAAAVPLRGSEHPLYEAVRLCTALYEEEYRNAEE